MCQTPLLDFTGSWTSRKFTIEYIICQYFIMYSSIVIFIVITLFKGTHGVIYYLNESEYNRMPPLFKLDDYESCLQHPSGIYCSVNFNLVSETESELLNMIIEYSEQTRTHYNHSQLTYGVCVTENCQTYIKDTKLVSKSALEACLNDTLMNEYQLMTQVTSLTCHSPKDAKEEFDKADIALAIILLAIFMINIIGSIYDLRYKMKENNVLACFSIQRNWKLLTCNTTNLDPRIECLKGLNGIRCIIIFGVIMVHSALPFLIAVQNTHDLELMYYKLRQNVVMTGSLVIQTNILISGFLLAYKIELYSENNVVGWNMIPKAFLIRYFRLTPVYAVVIAVIATWLRFLGNGPFWEVSGNLLHKHCRSDWWRSLLFINNYKYNSQCIIPAWYLGMDMQLFCLGIILCVLLRKKNWRKPVLTSVLFLGVIIIAVHTYVRDLDPIFIVSPEIARTLFGSDRTFNETYKMGHTNIPSFIIGMMLGYFVYQLQKTKVDVSKNKILRYLYWALVPLGLVVMFSGELFYRDAPRDPLTVRVVYAAVIKPFFATVMAMLIAGTIFKIDNVYRKALEWDKWTIPSRLSYCVFILHNVFIHVYVGLRHSLVVLSNMNSLLFMLAVTLVSLVTAVPLWLLVETPFTELIKYYSNKSHQKKLKKNDCKNTIPKLY